MIFIHGGDEDGYGADLKMADSLRVALGETYEVHYPKMPSDETLPDFGWTEKIGHEISSANRPIILVAHSLGASMLLKHLSENHSSKNISGIFLIATPHWHGDEDWKRGLKLDKGFAEKIPKGIPIFLYHCKDDDVVSFEDMEYYAQQLPQATVRRMTIGGHQLNNDLSLVAKDITSL